MRLIDRSQGRLWVRAAVVGAMALLLASCGSSSKQVAPEDVVAELQEKLQLPLSIDPRRASADASVLTPDDKSFGDFSLFVLNEGTEPTDLEIALMSVPPAGEQKWRAYQPYTSDLPGLGTYTVLKTYEPNLVLQYSVEGRPSSSYDYGYPPSPDALVLLDETLASMTGTDTGTGPTSGFTEGG